MDEFLTREELEILTGWKHKEKQTEHLRIIGVPFFVAANGKPVVPRIAVREGLAKKQASKKEPKKWKPSVID